MKQRSVPRCPASPLGRLFAVPIHGMDEAMGLGKSWLSGWVLFGGITGFLTAAVVEFGPSSILYPSM